MRDPSSIVPNALRSLLEKTLKHQQYMPARAPEYCTSGTDNRLPVDLSRRAKVIRTFHIHKNLHIPVFLRSILVLIAMFHRTSCFREDRFLICVICVICMI